MPVQMVLNALSKSDAALRLALPKMEMPEAPKQGQQAAPTLISLQTALRQPMASHEWQEIVDYTQQRWQATPQTVLTTAQIQDVLNQVFALRVNNNASPLETRDIQPIYSPLFPALMEPLRQLSARPGLALFALVVAIVVMLMVL